MKYLSYPAFSFIMPALIAITIISVIISICCICKRVKTDNITKAEQDNLIQEINKLSTQKSEIENNINSINILIAEREKYLDNYITQIDQREQLSEKAYENYWNVLDNKYKETEQEFQDNINLLSNSYSKMQLDLIQENEKLKSRLNGEIEGYKVELDKIKATHAAAIEASRRQKEIEGNLSFYCLNISDADKSDMSKLETIKPSLNKPRILSMLIWSTWVRDALKTLCANVAGTEPKTGVYKITNIVTKECYIGQSVNIQDRFSQHCKCGLGIDTPPGNKLYKAMQEYGIWNFSFEILETCTRQELDEKEKQFIDIYDSCNSGYNSTKGNN